MNTISSYTENPLLGQPTNFKHTSCISTNLTGMKNITECILPNVTIIDEQPETFFEKLIKIFGSKKAKSSQKK